MGLEVSFSGDFCISESQICRPFLFGLPSEVEIFQSSWVQLIKLSQQIKTVKLNKSKQYFDGHPLASIGIFSHSYLALLVPLSQQRFLAVRVSGLELIKTLKSWSQILKAQSRKGLNLPFYTPKNSILFFFVNGWVHIEWKCGPQTNMISTYLQLNPPQK